MEKAVLFLIFNRPDTTAEAFERIRAAEQLRREFGQAVGRGVAVAPGVGDYRTGADTLVLALPEQRYIVLGLEPESKRCFRMDLLASGDGFEARRFTSFSLPLAALRFEYDVGEPGGARLVTLYGEVAGDGVEQPARPWTVHCTAALRGIDGGGVENAR